MRYRAQDLHIVLQCSQTRWNWFLMWGEGLYNDLSDGDSQDYITAAKEAQAAYDAAILLP